MPLTLDCYQPDDGNVDACEVTALKFKLAVSGPGIQSATLTLSSDSLGPITFNANLGADLDLTADLETWIDEWDSITCSFSIASTDALGRDPLPAAFLTVTPMFLIERTCSAGTMTDQFLANAPEDTDQCLDDVDGVVGIQAGVAGSVFSGIVYKSRPLNSCTSAGPVTMSGFEPNPKDVTKFEVVSADGTFCLYASGGTPPYAFWIMKGALACGLSLDPDTGCLTGTKTGTCPGSQEVEFLVQDAAGQTATVTCGFAPNCFSEAFGNVTF